METLKVGDLAYWDSFSGLIPCRVQSIVGPSGIASAIQRVDFVLTGSRGPYKRGEHQSTSGIYVVPRKSVKMCKYSTRIRAHYVQGDK